MAIIVRHLGAGVIFLSHMTEMPELFDLYDPTGRPLGRTKPRDEVHRDGDWHRSAHVWIFTSDHRLLFQRRASDKDTWPGRLDASVGGHYHAGESVEEGVRREAREELGLTLTPDELIPLGVRRMESRGSGIDDRELQDIYLLRRDLPLTAYRPDPVELDALVLLDAADAAWLHAEEIEPESELDDIPSAEAVSLVVGPNVAIRPITVTPRDLIPGRGSYITAIARAVGDVLAGRPPRQLSGEWRDVGAGLVPTQGAHDGPTTSGSRRKQLELKESI